MTFELKLLKQAMEKLQALEQRKQELWLDGATSAYPSDETGATVCVDSIVWRNIMRFLNEKDK